jgi:hypothetical protein
LSHSDIGFILIDGLDEHDDQLSLLSVAFVLNDDPFLAVIAHLVTVSSIKLLSKIVQLELPSADKRLFAVLEDGE